MRLDRELSELSSQATSDQAQHEAVLRFALEGVALSVRRTRHPGARLCDDDPQEPGLGFPAVVIPITTQHYTMLARNLVYTGVTRGKRLVVIVGQKKALGIAVRGGQMKPRWTKLGEWLAR